MTKFIDGPAMGHVLALRNVPKFLRVVQDVAKGDFDALDAADDKPRPSESIFVYRLVKHEGNMHVCSRGKNRKASGYYPLSTYELFPEQPSDGVMRDPVKWGIWVSGQEVAKAFKEVT